MNMSQSSRKSRTNYIARILRSLVEGEKTFYSLSRKERIASNKPILQALNELRFKGLVEKGEVGKRKRIPYRLTLPGLCAALTLNSDLWNEIDAIAERWKNLDPLILGNWKLISSVDREGVIDTLKKVAEEIGRRYLEYDRDKPVGRRDVESAVKYFRKAFFLERFTMLKSIKIEAVFLGTQEWRRTVLENQEIKKFVAEEARRWMEDLRSTLDNMKNLVKMMENILKDLGLLQAP